MKKIILGLFLLGIFSFSIQTEAQACDSRSYEKHNYSNRGNYKKVKHHRMKRRRNSRIVYVQPRGHYTPMHNVNYYNDYASPFIGFGYSNYNSGYHIQVGFD